MVQSYAESDTERTASWIRKNTKDSLIPFLVILDVVSLVSHRNEHEGLMILMQDIGSLSNPPISPFIKDALGSRSLD